MLGAREVLTFIESCVESQVQHLVRSTGRQELEGQRSVLTSQYRRLVSTCIVRAQAQCLLSRLRVISPAARDAALRREMMTRRERELRDEKRAQWMASLAGPGWARRGKDMTTCQRVLLKLGTTHPTSQINWVWYQSAVCVLIF